MVRWKVFIGGKQKGPDYNNEKQALNIGEVVARSNKQVFVYQTVNGDSPKQRAKWIDGVRVG